MNKHENDMQDGTAEHSFPASHPATSTGVVGPIGTYRHPGRRPSDGERPSHRRTATNDFSASDLRPMIVMSSKCRYVMTMAWPCRWTGRTLTACTRSDAASRPFSAPAFGLTCNAKRPCNMVQSHAKPCALLAAFQRRTYPFVRLASVEFVS